MIPNMYNAINCNLKGSNKAVFLALCIRADKTGSARPALDTLSNDAGVSRRTTLRALSSLKEKGVVSIRKRSGRSSLYLLNMQWINSTPATTKAGDDEEKPVSYCHPTSANMSQQGDSMTPNPCHHDTQKEQEGTEEGTGKEQAAVFTSAETPVKNPTMKKEEESMKAEEVLQHVKDTQKKYSPTTQKAKIEHLWKVTMADWYPEMYVVPFTSKERGQVGHILKKAQLAKVEHAIPYVIEHWDKFTDFAKHELGLTKPSVYPTLGYVLKYFGDVLEFVRRSEEDTAVAAQVVQGKPKVDISGIQTDNSWLEQAKAKLYGGKK